MIVITDLLRHLVGYCDPQNNDKVFASINFVMWSVDTNYDSFDVDPLEWMTAAGDIANEVASNDLEAFEIWRDYQYQVTRQRSH